jgi:hypothetical protein
VVAFALLVPGAALCLARREDGLSAGRLLACFGLGCLGFSLFRLVLVACYRDALWWAGFWEEMTEWLSMAAIALALIVFRGSLWSRERAAASI